MLTPVKLQIFGSHAGTLSPFTYGVAAGIYGRHGLDVTYRFLGATKLNAHEQVAGGDGDFAVGDTLSFLKLLAKGLPLTAVMGTLQGTAMGLMVHESLDITEPHHLKGRSIGVTLRLTGNLLKAYLEVNEIDPSEVTILPSLSSVRNERFVSGEVDAAVGNAIVDTAHFAEEGAPNKVIPFNFENAFIQFILTTRRELAEADPDLVRCFVRATAEAYIEAYADPSGAAQSMIDAFPGAAHPRHLLEKQLLGIATYSCTKRNAGQPFGSMSADDWDESIAFARRHLGLTGEPLDLADVFTNEFTTTNPIAPSWAYEWKTA